MFKGIPFVAGILLWSVFAAANTQDQTPGVTQVRSVAGLHINNVDSTPAINTFSQDATVSIVNVPSNQQPVLHSLNGGVESRRLLVRLKSSASLPYFKQQREKLSAGGKVSRTGQQALAKTTASYRQGLQKSQLQLVDELRRKNYVQQVHHRFVDLTNTLSVSAPVDAIPAIRSLPQVAEVYVDNEVKALLDDSVAVTQAPSLWSMRDTNGNFVTGRGVSVAILDTGIDYTHPDLGGCIGTGCKVVAGYNFVAGEQPGNFIDRHGHGTHVAGIVAAKGRLQGVAPDVSLYAYKVLDDRGGGFDSAIIAALEKAVDPDGDPLTQDQINIVNMSLGGPGKPDSPLAEAANNAMEAGTLVVVAAGNSGSDYSTIGVPGNAEQVLTVGATDNNGALASFTSRGPVVDATYVKPELVAPGVDINSTAPGAGYAIKSGTSMATPHVAGGAALLKQLRPQLTAAEIKDLLISSASDLGQDVFIQGAGMMKLAEAANANVLVSPVLLNAGRVDLTQPAFAKNISFQVKNLTNTSQTLSFTPSVNLPQGASLKASANSAILEAGAATKIDLQLDVDTAVLPFADSATLHHQLNNNLQVGGQSLRLPLVFSKSALLNIQWGGRPFVLMVFNDDGTQAKMFSYPCDNSSLANAPPPEAVYVKPGKFHIAVSFMADNNCYTVAALVFKENIDVKTIATIDASPATAIYDFSLTGVISPAGQNIELDELNVYAKDVAWAHNRIDNLGQVLSLGDGGRKIIKVSEVSPNFRLSTSIFLKKYELDEQTPATFYVLQDSFAAGINENKTLNIDARTAAGMHFRYDDPLHLADGVVLLSGFEQLRSLASGNMSVGASRLENTVFHKPLEVDVYSDVSTFMPNEWYPYFGIFQSNPNVPYDWSKPLLRTGLVAFEDTNSYTKLRGTLSKKEDSVYRSKDRNLIVENNGYFLTGAFLYTPASKNIMFYDNNNSYGIQGVQYDYAQNMFYDPMRYQQFCNGVPIKNGETTGSGFEAKFDGVTCATLGLEFELLTRFQQQEHKSYIMLTVETKIADAYQNTRDSPTVQQVIFLNDGIPSRILNGKDAQLRVKAADRYWQRSTLSEKTLVEYRLKDDEPWVTLSTEVDGGELKATLPDVSGGHWLSVRLTISNDNGMQMVQTLNDVAMIGNNLPKAPQFDALPDLVVEATGPLTAFTLPPVTAKNEQGEATVATTADLGPYALGTHQIRWQVIDANGKTSKATQRLIVRDTTPPELIAPADIRIKATGVYTPVFFVPMVATDLVDGIIGPSVSDVGPFTVGTHTLIWSAADKAGNTATVQQQVIIDPMPQSSGSSSSTISAIASSRASSNSGNTDNNGGNSGGGGGGSSGGILLLLFGCLGLFNIL
ncbi:S8 family serine peptidase, partial [Cellvibrio mixtus]|uniref:S8 family serine peptidase n=1 Tax=Cellvibrio mixtus TaxID=39650 RepID=UPI0012698FA0